MTAQQDWPVSGQMVATLPLPAVVVPDLAGVRQAGERVARRIAGSGSRGRHAAPRQPLLPRVFDGSRFLLFSAIGGFVFLLGFGVQAWLTSGLKVAPIASYLVQALLSIEASFLLNRWLTWRDRNTPFWQAFARFNAQKTVTIALNMALYVGLLWLGMNYLIANVALTALFTIVNFVAGDRFVFVPAGSRFAGRTVRPAALQGAGLATLVAPPVAPSPRVRTLERSCPPVSVVIPCRGNEETIGSTVRSLLAQDYPCLAQIVLIGSPGDSTWKGLAGIKDRRLVMREIETPKGLRDANYKRNAGIRGATSDLIALVDSDIVLPPDWLGGAVEALERSGVNCVAGGMRSIHDTYWGRYTDSTRVGAKTPRIDMSYTVTKSNFGAGGRKPPITANVLFTRELYDGCPIDASWSHGSYEDYEWFWRVVSDGYSVQVREDMFGWHHHRRGVRPLIKEYLRSSRGCAYFIKAHMDCPFARRRLNQAVVLPFGGLAMMVAVAGAVVGGYGVPLGVLALAATVGFAADQIVQSRRLESLLYPLTGLGLGLVFTVGLVTNLIKASVRPSSSPARPAPGPSPRASSALPSAAAVTAGAAYVAADDAIERLNTHDAQLKRLAASSPADFSDRKDRRPGKRMALASLAAICALQVAVSLTLVWSNTAFTDEADNLWIGRLVLAHWLHGRSWPASYGQQILPGSPLIYPPLGQLANSIGGLAGARILSLVFMVAATVLLYSTVARLIGRTAAVFASILWVLTEPVLRAAFATPQSLSLFLVALSAWLIVQAGCRRRHGELVAAAAVVLAVSNAAAYNSVIFDPFVFGFAYLVWRASRPSGKASYSTAWLCGAWAASLGLLLTRSRSWTGFWAELSSRYLTSHQSISLTLTQIWEFTGFILILALAGIVVALGAADRWRKVLLVLLGTAGLVVPVVQLANRSTDLLDGRLAFGIWFAAIAAGYACAALISWLAGVRKSFAVLLSALALCYPLATSWQSAWEQYHGWPNAKSFINTFRSNIGQADGFIFAASQVHVAEYYTSQGDDWARWKSSGLSLAPPKPPTVAYYLHELRSENYGLVALFYSTSFTATYLPSHLLTTPKIAKISQELLSQAGLSQSEPGLSALTTALQRDRSYRLLKVGSYDSANGHGLYAIWRKVAPR